MIIKNQALLYKEGLTISGVKRNLSSNKKDDAPVNNSSKKIIEDLELLLKVIN